jgi:hypothetical protein
VEQTVIKIVVLPLTHLTSSVGVKEVGWERGGNEPAGDNPLFTEMETRIVD